ncbi:MAG: twin-arginine translocase TatA/TatE family subunit [Deferribacteraceae bacterium]|jgi:sec-independent protein translocase protein TatA|nr:twin-arginine translocase TatA/TatE family subunit [Deferribacteraceae bacterium]
MISGQNILIILLVVVLLFGASKLPQIGEGMGKAIRNFKKSVSDLDTDVEDITPPKKVAKKEKESDA